MEIQDDVHIVEQVLAGNVNAYATIISKYKDKAFTLALRILHNREDAEEAAQDAFIKCYYGLPDFKFDSSFGTWLYRIVYTSAISLLRKNNKYDIYKYDFYEIEEFEAFQSFSELNSALEKLKNEEQKFYLTEAMRKLSAQENTMIFLYYQADKNIEEIRHIFNLSKANVKIKLFRARQKLFKELNNLLKKEVRDLL